MRQAEPERTMVLYMDNATIHFTKLVRQVCSFFGVSIIFTSPYSPATNPIEYSFATLKQKMRGFVPKTE